MTHVDPGARGEQEPTCVGCGHTQHERLTPCGVIVESMGIPCGCGILVPDKSNGPVAQESRSAEWRTDEQPPSPPNHRRKGRGIQSATRREVEERNHAGQSSEGRQAGSIPAGATPEERIEMRLDSIERILNAVYEHVRNEGR